MSFSGFIVQLINGLASASSLFLVAAGLSLIFGVTRIVNFAHGSFFMVGIYVAYSLVERLSGAFGFWVALPLAALIVGVLGALIEVVLLRRIYKAPELFQLLATFALVLVIKDAVLWLWGPDELLGPRAPGLSGSVSLLGRQFPTYDLFLIVVGPLVLGAVWLLLTRTRFGTLVRAATQDREMVSALGVNQAWLFTAVFALGAMLAGLGGALQLPREPATLEMDLHTIGAAFVVVVVGGMGSIPGAYAAALLISEIKAICIWLGVVDVFGVSVSFSKLTLVVDFLVMAVVLVWRPWGLFGRPQAPSRYVGMQEEPLRRPGKAYLVAAAVLGLLLAAAPLLTAQSPYTTVLLIDLLIAALFAASLHFIMGPAGMHSFGHAAYFGLGAYGAALLVRIARAADGDRTGRGAAGGGGRRVRLRLVRGAAVGRLPGHADAGLRPDHLGHHLPVGQFHRWQQRPHRCLARGMAGGQAHVLLAHAGCWWGRGCGGCAACCSRRSAMRCAPGAIRCCAPTPSASTSSACSGRPLWWRARLRGWRAHSMRSPRAAFRRNRWPLASRWTGW